LKLRNQDDARMIFALPQPILVYETEVAGGVAVVAGNNGAPLSRGFGQDRPIILLNLNRQFARFEDIISM
jgi:hypothetical protein